MTAVPGWKMPLNQRRDALQVPPALQLQGKASRFSGETRLGIKLGKGCLDGCNIPAVSVEEIYPLEPMSCQGAHPITDCRDERGWSKRYRSRKTEMVLRHADVESRPNQNVGCLLGFVGDDLRTQPIGT